MNNYYKAIGVRINGIYSLNKASKILGVTRKSVSDWTKKPDCLYHFTPSIRRASSKRVEYTMTGKQIFEIYRKRYGLPDL